MQKIFVKTLGFFLAYLPPTPLLNDQLDNANFRKCLTRTVPLQHLHFKIKHFHFPPICRTKLSISSVRWINMSWFCSCIDWNQQSQTGRLALWTGLKDCQGLFLLSRHYRRKKIPTICPFWKTHSKGFNAPYDILRSRATHLLMTKVKVRQSWWGGEV